jgi:hypothetical protein
MNLMSDINSWFGMQNPANGAQSYLNQVPGYLNNAFNPYVNAGQQALPTLQNQYNSLINNPAGVMQSIGSQYQQSPGYQWQVGQGMNSVNNAAAAGGMLGTPQAQQQAATMTEGLANQDYYNYLNHALGLYSGGLQGLSGINQMGYDASAQKGQDLSQNAMSQANLAYSGQANQNQMNGGMAGAGMGFLGNLMSGIFNGGSSGGGNNGSGNPYSGSGYSGSANGSGGGGGFLDDLVGALAQYL